MTPVRPVALFPSPIGRWVWRRMLNCGLLALYFLISKFPRCIKFVRAAADSAEIVT